MNLQEKSLQAFRRLASGVSVVSSGNKTERFAMTASSVTSVSMEPPSLLVCIHKETEITQFLKKHNQMCINLLSNKDVEISNICAASEQKEQRFKTGSWLSSSTHLPYLEDAQANIFCEIDKRSRYATHDIYFARIIDVKYKEEIDPLLYLNHQYGSFESNKKAG